jgi:hypothetical protein
VKHTARFSLGSTVTAVTFSESPNRRLPVPVVGTLVFARVASKPFYRAADMTARRTVGGSNVPPWVLASGGDSR